MSAKKLRDLVAGDKAKGGHRPHRNNYGLPGPNPPRNALGGFKVVGLGAIERSGPSGITGAKIEDRTCSESPCGHSFPAPATFIPPWVKYAVQLAHSLTPDGKGNPHIQHVNDAERIARSQ